MPEGPKGHTTAYYSWEEVMEMRATSYRVKRRFCIHLLPEYWECSEWITIGEAAKTIGISYKTMQNLIRRRIFVFRYKRETDKTKRYLLSKLQVEKYRDDKERQRRNAAMKSAKAYIIPPPLTEAEEAAFEQKKWLTIPEAAQCLGVSIATIYTYSTSGRLRRYPVGVAHGRCQRWWVDYEDVKHLREDPEYQERRARWRSSIKVE